MKAFDKKTKGLLNAIDLRQNRGKLLYWGIFAIVMLMSLFVILPCIWVLLSCFKEPTEFYATPPKLIPNNLDFSKLADVWNQYDLLKYYGNSFVMVAGEILFTVGICGLGGYVLSRLKVKGAALIFNLMFWSMLLPETTKTVPLFMTFVDFPLLHINMTNTYLPMFLKAGANSYYVLLFRSFFNGIPMTYLEAARIDGCSDFGIFFKIILPLSKPIIVVISIFTFNSGWGSFLWPYLLIKSNDILPLAVKIYDIGNAVTIDRYLCLLLFAMIPPTIIFSIFSKQIMGGLSMDGIKG